MAFSILSTGRFLIAGAALMALAACGSSDGESDAAGTGAASSEAAKAAATSSVPESERTGTWGDLVYGDANAPVEVIEYASFTCPHCGSWSVTVFPQIKEKYIDTGKVKFIFRNFIRDRVDLAAAMTSRCSTPEVAKKLTQVFFERQNEWLQSANTVDALASFARRVGLSRTQVDRCIADVGLRDHLVEMTRTGDSAYNITGTPTLIIDGQNSDLDWASVEAAIEDAL